jgi:2-C-methyl-D-erythritol 2,4-cyclodiphosphate synthase
LGDLGRHFPDSDPQYRGISSLKLLETIRDRVQQTGYAILTIDSTVVAETPKLVPYMAAMQRALAGSLGISEEQISIKATTTEGLGFAGRQEGIAAYAVALLVRKDPQPLSA